MSCKALASGKTSLGRVEGFHINAAGPNPARTALQDQFRRRSRRNPERAVLKGLVQPLGIELAENSVLERSLVMVHSGSIKPRMTACKRRSAP